MCCYTHSAQTANHILQNSKQSDWKVNERHLSVFTSNDFKRKDWKTKIKKDLKQKEEKTERGGHSWGNSSQFLIYWSRWYMIEKDDCLITGATFILRWSCFDGRRPSVQRCDVYDISLKSNNVQFAFHCQWPNFKRSWQSSFIRCSYDDGHFAIAMISIKI